MPRRLSAAKMLAGAAPGRAPDWKACWTVRRLQARIVKRGPTIIGTESRVRPCGLGGPVSDGQGSTSFGARRLASARSAGKDAHIRSGRVGRDVGSPIFMINSRANGRWASAQKSSHLERSQRPGALLSGAARSRTSLRPHGLDVASSGLDSFARHSAAFSDRPHAS